MKKLMFLMISILACHQNMPAEGWFARRAREAREAVERAAHAVEHTAEKAVEKAKEVVTDNPITRSIKEHLKELENNETFKEIQTAAKNLKTMPPEPPANYCASIPETLNIDTQEDPDGMNQYIKKYAPIFFLHPAERAFPITANEAFTSQRIVKDNVVIQEGTGIEFRRCLDDRCKQYGPAQVVIPRGQVTMQKIWDIVQEEKTNNPKKYVKGKIYFTHDSCTRFGSNPANNTDKAGNLTTPVYVIVFECGPDICMTYLTLYGYNSPYQIRNPITGNVLLPGGGVNRGVTEIQNAHDMDLEHFTIVLDRTTKRIKKLYYGSHGRREGFWLNPDHPDIEWSGARGDSNPFVYVAHGGHGLYTMREGARHGEYIRIFGFANDKISKEGKKWTPILIRVFASTDPHFDPNTMAWLAWGSTKDESSDHQASEDGVQGPESQGWYRDKKGDVGRLPPRKEPYTEAEQERLHKEGYDKQPFCAGDECKCLYGDYAILHWVDCPKIFWRRKAAVIPD